MRTLSYILLYGFLATCGLATGQEIATQGDAASGQVAYGEQQRKVVREWLRLTYGLQDNPSQSFEHLTATLLTPEQYKKTWFALGRALYLRGEYSAAGVALMRINGKLPEEIRQDYPLLLAQTLMAQGDYERAITLLESIANRKPGAPYARYNLGVAQLKSGRQSQAIDTLDALGNISADTPELQALRDQTNITLGYIYLDRKKTSAAKQALKRASLNGLYANKALLALGWAEWQAKNPRLAQTAWSALLDGDMASPITQEALSGVPQALWRLESHTQARKKFNTAISAYQTQISQLDDVIEQSRAKTWLPDVFNDISPDDLNLRNIWLRMDNTPLSPYLREMLANQPLQNTLQKHLALLHLENQLATPSHLHAEIQRQLGITIDPARINTFNKDLQQLKQQLPALKTRQQDRLQTLIMDVLEQQKKQLEDYLVNAQYALARLLDELASKKP